MSKKGQIKELMWRTIKVNGVTYTLIETDNGAEVWGWKSCIGSIKGMDVFDETKVSYDELVDLIKDLQDNQEYQ